MPEAAPTAYAKIIEAIFRAHHKVGATEVPFERQELADTAAQLGIARPKNLGDIVYTFTSRAPFPQSISSLAPAGKEWVIRKKGRSAYCFALVKEWSIEPTPLLLRIKVPDATPGIINQYRLDDEQSLLAKLRYNRLIDIFTGLTCYSLQNHLRRGVAGIGQVETDELYVAVNRHGAHSVLPVQAKGGRDRMNVVQIEKDFALCAQDFSGLTCRPIGAQFMADDVIALFEFILTDEGVALRYERHYQLVPPEDITAAELASYRLPSAD